MKIKKRKPKNTLAVNAVCSVEELPTVLGESYGQIMQFMKEKNTFPTGAPFVIYKNDDMQALDLEIGFPVMKRVDGNGEVKAGLFPGGVCAVARHRGPYSTIEKTYKNLTAFIKEKGKNPSGICYEVYLNDPLQEGAVGSSQSPAAPVIGDRIYRNNEVSVIFISRFLLTKKSPKAPCPRTCRSTKVSFPRLPGSG